MLSIINIIQAYLSKIRRHCNAISLALNEVIAYNDCFEVPCAQDRDMNKEPETRKRFIAAMLGFIFIVMLFSGCTPNQYIEYSNPEFLSYSTADPASSTNPIADPVTAPEPEPTTDMNYRHEMRQFVQGISAYMKGRKPGFAVIPQNGEHIAFGETGVFREYMDAVDGIGREDFLYGYEDENAATPEEDREFMRASMNIYREYGKSVLVIDYCSSPEKVRDSYDTNQEYGFISFAADRRELNNIPDMPQPVFNENADDIRQISDAKNFLYIINPESFSSKSDFLDAIGGTNYDLVIVDLFFEDTPLSASDIARIKVKENGAERLVVCYMSIGEAEDYRYYWQDDWAESSPAWLGGENPDWEGNYNVKYWDPKWQGIIYGNDRSYAKMILDAGFDGVYLDLIDAFEYYEQ